MRWCNPIGKVFLVLQRKKKFSAGLDVADQTESLECRLTDRLPQILALCKITPTGHPASRTCPEEVKRVP